MIAELGQRLGAPPRWADRADGPAAALDRDPVLFRRPLAERIDGGVAGFDTRRSRLSVRLQWPFTLESPPSAPSPNGALRLGTFRSIWASPEVGAAPALAFLHPGQTVELSPADAQRLGVDDGESVEVSREGARVRARVTLRTDAPQTLARPSCRTRFPWTPPTH